MMGDLSTLSGIDGADKLAHTRGSCLPLGLFCHFVLPFCVMLITKNLARFEFWIILSITTLAMLVSPFCHLTAPFTWLQQAYHDGYRLLNRASALLMYEPRQVAERSGAIAPIQTPAKSNGKTYLLSYN